MEKFADLHLHTNCSDGIFSPAQTVAKAKENGLSCISITDHDTFEGVFEGVQTGQEMGVEVIAGVELSCEQNNKDIHILGYFADYQNQKLIGIFNKMQNTRVQRMQKMIDKLKNFGIDNITLEEVCARTNSDSVGRPHLATILKEKKWVPDIKTAFDKYISEHAPAYVPKFKQTPEEAIKLIKSMGGVAVLAHPMVTRIDELIPRFSRAGLDGLEVYYPNTSQTVLDFYSNLAGKYGLIVTGGSDAHGGVKDNTYIGKIKLPYHFVKELKKRL